MSWKDSVMKVEIFTDQFIIGTGTNHIGHFGFTIYICVYLLCLLLHLSPCCCRDISVKFNLWENFLCG